MWQSQDDIVNDLASLNDFGSPGDKEPYKVLYSIGRGSKFKEKNKSSEKFLDSRTGEVIDTEDETFDNDYCYQGKGRGSLLGGFSRSEFQLQQQLRLARPLGSGDEAIESYCRRNQPIENPRNSTTVCGLEMDTKSVKIKGNLNLDRMKHRIKAVRNSSTDCNALINGLLTKSNKNSAIQLTNKGGSFVRNEENERKDKENLDKTLNFNNVIVNCSDNGGVVETKVSTERSSLKNLSDEDEFLKGECSGKAVCLKDTFSPSNKTLKSSRAVQVVSVETNNYFKEEKEQRNEEINEIKGTQNYSENNLYNSANIQPERSEKYRILGEKLNRLRKIGPKTSESGMYDFSEISRYIAPMGTDSETNSKAVNATNPVPKYFVFKDEEFPPLLSGNLKPLD